jgi:hypothetical protein
MADSNKRSFPNDSDNGTPFRVETKKHDVKPTPQREEIKTKEYVQTKLDLREPPKNSGIAIPSVASTTKEIMQSSCKNCSKPADSDKLTPEGLCKHCTADASFFNVSLDVSIIENENHTITTTTSSNDTNSEAVPTTHDAVAPKTQESPSITHCNNDKETGNTASTNSTKQAKSTKGSTTTSAAMKKTNDSNRSNNDINTKTSNQKQSAIVKTGLSNSTKDQSTSGKKIADNKTTNNKNNNNNNKSKSGINTSNSSANKSCTTNKTKQSVEASTVTVEQYAEKQKGKHSSYTHDDDMYDDDWDDDTDNIFQPDDMNDNFHTEESDVELNAKYDENAQDDNSSFIMKQDDKDLLADTLAGQQGTDFNERQLHAMANATCTTIDTVKIRTSIKETMICDTRMQLTDESFDTKLLEGYKLKILYKYLKLKFPQGRVNPTKHNKLMGTALKKLRTTQQFKDIDPQGLQHMASVTGIFYPDKCMTQGMKNAVFNAICNVLKSKSKKPLYVDRFTRKIIFALVLDLEEDASETESDEMSTNNSTDTATIGNLSRSDSKSAPKYASIDGKFSSTNIVPPTTKNTTLSAKNSSTKKNDNSNNHSSSTNKTSNQAATVATKKSITPNHLLPGRITQESPAMSPPGTGMPTALQGRAAQVSPARMNHSYTTRFDIRVEVVQDPLVRSNLDLVFNHIVRILKELMKCDPYIAVVPWSTKDANQNVLDLDKKIPSLQALQRYFNRIRNVEKGPSYGEMRLLHKTKWSDILYDTGSWLSRQGHGVYHKELQVEKSANVGWLMFSFRAIDTTLLARVLFEMHGITVSFRWAVISLGTGSIIQTPIKALHIVVESGEPYNRAKTILQSIYGSSVTTFPLGICLRYIPTIANLGPQGLEIVKRLRRKQQSFLDLIEGRQAKSWEINCLDISINQQPPLRELLMSVTSPSQTQHKLFISVDTAYNKQDLVLFTYLPRFEDEVRGFLGIMVPYLIKKNGPEIEEYFSADSVARAAEMEFNEETQQVTTKDDAYLSTLLDDENDVAFFGVEFSPEALKEPSFASRKIERVYLRDEADSVGTFTSMRTNETNGPNIQASLEPASVTLGNVAHRPIPVHRTIDLAAQSSSITIQSTMTDSDRLSNVENNFAALSRSIAEMNNKFDRMIEVTKLSTPNVSMTNASETGATHEEGTGNE